MLYPFKFQPLFVEKIWGGQKLKKILGKEVGHIQHCGESWEIFDVGDQISEVVNGFLAENNLEELIEVYMGDLVGDKVFNEYGLQFPLLFKYIDAQEDLSVQVHPDDALAMRRYGCNGKSEMWYVIDADAGAGIYLGFKKGVKKQDYLQAVKNGSVDQLLVFYPVQKGDCFYVPAGTVHAIGKGVLLAEIQQSSDCTYRIFDWNRVDAFGLPRELHTAEAEEALHFNDKTDYKIQYESKFNQSVLLVDTPHFKVSTLQFNQPMEKIYAKIDSFVVYMCIEGSVHVIYEDKRTHLQKGETILVPAIATNVMLLPQKNVHLLEIYM